MTGRREKTPWAERGYRRRSELPPGQSMTLAERRIEQLEGQLRDAERERDRCRAALQVVAQEIKACPGQWDFVIGKDGCGGTLRTEISALVARAERLEAAALNVRDAPLGNVQRMVDGRAFNQLDALLPRTSQRTREDRND